MSTGASLYDRSFSVTSIEGAPVAVDSYRGHVLLVVNVASRCGFTPQYEDLERLHNRFRPRDFAVLGFPCDQFGHQEPGTDAEIRTFCSGIYGVTFPMFSKVRVNGAHADPIFRFLKSEARGAFGVTRVLWNFTKFLVGRDGIVIRRYAPNVAPPDIAPAIEAALRVPAPNR